MTCASCAVRVEKTLNRLDGVEATVNYATDEATVSFDPHSVRLDDLVAAVEASGYHASLPADAVPREDAARYWLVRLVVSAALTAPLALLAMTPALQFSGWEWLALALSTPVVFWGGWPFHRATVLNLRHRAVTMDTLISLGTLSAWTWSTVVLLAGIDDRHLLRGRGGDHDADPARPLPRGPRPRPLGRGDPRAARARRQGGAGAARRRGGARSRRRAAPRRPLRRPAGRDDRHRRRRRGRRVRDRPVDAHRRAHPRRGRPRRRGRRRDAEHVRAPRSCARRGSEPRPHSRGSPASSPRHRRARRRSSGSSTASRRCSCRS